MGADGSKAGGQEGQAEGGAGSGDAPPPNAEEEAKQAQAKEEAKQVAVPDMPAKTDKPEEERAAAVEQAAAENKTAAEKPAADDKAADKTAADKAAMVDEQPAEAPALDKPSAAQAVAAVEQRTADKPAAEEKPAAAEASQAPPRGARATDSAAAPEVPAVAPEAARPAEEPAPRAAVVRGTPAPKAPAGPAPAPKAPEPRGGASAPQAPAGPAPAAKGAPAAAGKPKGAADGGKGPKEQTKGKVEAGAAAPAPPGGKKGKGGESAGVQLSVRNLSKHMTNETLSRLFSAYGTVTHALVKMTPEGQCRGFGFVKFSTAEEADAAIKGTHLQPVDGKLLHVELSVSRVQTPSDAQWPAGKGTMGDVKGAKGKGKGSDIEPTDVLKRLLAVGSHEGVTKGGGKPIDPFVAYWKGKLPAKGGKAPGDWAKGGDWPKGDWGKGDWAKGDWAKGDRAKGDWAKGDWAKGEWAKGDWAKGDWAKGDWSKGKDDWGKAKGEWAKGAGQKGDQAKGYQAKGKGPGKGHATEITNRMLSEWKTVGGQVLQEQAGAPPGDHSRRAPERPYYGGGGGDYGSPWAAGSYGWQYDGEPTAISLDGNPSAAQSRAAHESRLAQLNSSAARLHYQANLAQQQALSGGYGQGLPGSYPAAGAVGTLAQAAAAVAAARLRQAFERQGHFGLDAYDAAGVHPPDPVFVDALPVPSAAALAAAERELAAGAAKERERASASASSPPRPGNGEYSGHLKSVSSKNGFGFISCKETHDLYNRDVYVDQAQLPEGTKLGDKLQFMVKLSDKGHPRAVRVVKLD